MGRRSDDCGAGDRSDAVGDGNWEGGVQFSYAADVDRAWEWCELSGYSQARYEYGSTAAVNNGNVTKQTITVPGVAQPFVQTYTYDELNRLTNAEEIKNSVQQWEQAFTFDRFGNRNFNDANTSRGFLQA